MESIILHQLYSWEKGDTLNCPRCITNTGTLIHMLWQCPKLHRYWEGVIDILNSLSSTRVHFDPKIALLWIIPEDTLPAEMHVMWLRTMYMARKLVLQKWISKYLPTIAQWIKAINLNLRPKELTYKHRKSPKKNFKNLLLLAGF